VVKAITILRILALLFTSHSARILFTTILSTKLIVVFSMLSCIWQKKTPKTQINSHVFYAFLYLTKKKPPKTHVFGWWNLAASSLKCIRMLMWVCKMCGSPKRKQKHNYGVWWSAICKNFAGVKGATGKRYFLPKKAKKRQNRQNKRDEMTILRNSNVVSC